MTVTRAPGGRPVGSTERFTVVSSLARGAALTRAQPLQDGEAQGDGLYFAAILHEDAFALELGPHLSPNDRERAREIGVEIVEAPGLDFRLEGGSAEDIRDWLADVVGLQFDRALRDPELFAELMAPKNFYVRVADAPDLDIPYGPSAPNAEEAEAIARLQRHLRFATTLE